MIKQKIRILSADFGSTKPKDFLDIPTQETSEFDIETYVYNDNNYFSRQQALSPRLKGKIPKMLDWMNNDADYYIWIDSYYTITSTRIYELVKYVLDHEICLNKHYTRSTIEEECNFVSQEIKNSNTYLTERYQGEPLEAQVSSYLKDKTFIDNSLYALGFFIYKKSLVQSMSNLMSDWFFHNCYWSVQDQLSMPYLLHKHNIIANTFDFEAIYNNPYALYIR